MQLWQNLVLYFFALHPVYRYSTKCNETSCNKTCYLCSQSSVKNPYFFRYGIGIGNSISVTIDLDIHILFMQSDSWQETWALVLTRVAGQLSVKSAHSYWHWQCIERDDGRLRSADHRPLASLERPTRFLFRVTFYQHFYFFNRHVNSPKQGLTWHNNMIDWTSANSQQWYVLGQI